MQDSHFIPRLFGKLFQFDESVVAAVNRRSPDGRSIRKDFEEVVVAVHGSISPPNILLSDWLLYQTVELLTLRIEHGEPSCNAVPLGLRAEFDGGN